MGALRAAGVCCPLSGQDAQNAARGDALLSHRQSRRWQAREGSFHGRTVDALDLCVLRRTAGVFPAVRRAFVYMVAPMRQTVIEALEYSMSCRRGQQ